MTYLSPSHETPPDAGAKRILIVEDEMLIALGAMSDLELDGYDVVIVGDGRQGLEAATHEKIDLIITDSMMPRMNGLDMIDALRRAGVTLPIVLTTSINQDSLPQHQRAGYDFYLCKPYRSRDICSAAKRFGPDFHHSSVSRPSATRAGSVELEFA